MRKKRRPDSSAALSYEPGRDAAPRVTARGRGPLAERIVRLAEEHGIPVQSDPVLAEALSRFPEGDPIPEELYVAVAEVYAFLIRSSRMIPEREKVPPGKPR